MFKKSVIYLLIVFCCMMQVACANTKEQKIYMVDRTVLANKYVMCGEEHVKFCVDFIYKGEIPNMKINGLSGTGIENLEYEGEVVSEEFATKKYKDYSLFSYIITLNVADKRVNDCINIDGVYLCINGEDEEIKFDEPLKYTFIDESVNNVEYLQAEKTPDVFCGMDTVLSYSYVATKNLTIQSIGTLGVISFKDLKVFVNGNYKGDASSFPVEIMKGDKIEFEVVPEFSGKEYNWTNVYTNVLVGYTMDNKKCMSISDISLLPIDSEEDIKEVIEHMIK